jgi:hypothetical protein
MRIELAEMGNLFAVFIKCCGKKATWRGEIGEQFPLIKQFSPELPVNLSFVSIQSFLYEG